MNNQGFLARSMSTIVFVLMAPSLLSLEKNAFGGDIEKSMPFRYYNGFFLGG